MEGNFRIVQLSDCEFMIQKEIVKTIEYPWYTFKKKESVSEWRKVNEKGRVPNSYCLFDESVLSTLEEAKDSLRQIKKYPIYYTE